MIATRQKLGIIGGAGNLPLQIARISAAKGRDCHLVAVEEFAAPVPASISHTRVPISKLGTAIRVLRQEGCVEVLFAGKFVRPTEGQVRFRPDWEAIRFVIGNLGVFRRSDDGVHRAIEAAFQRYGFKVVSPLDAAPELAAVEGPLTRCRPAEAISGQFADAMRRAREHGSSGHGQAIVYAQGQVLAREGKPGTDAMLMGLARPVPAGAFLVKTMAPNQLPTMDPPAIGESTITHAAEAGLAGVLIEAGRSIVVDPERVAARADELGLFVWAGRLAP